MTWEQLEVKVKGDKWPLLHCKHLNAKDKVGMVTVMNRNPGQWSDQESLTSETYGSGQVITASLGETQEGSITNSYLICMRERVLGQISRSLTRITKTESHVPSISTPKPVYRARILWIKGNFVPQRKNPSMQQKCLSLFFLSTFLRETYILVPG